MKSKWTRGGDILSGGWWRRNDRTGEAEGERGERERESKGRGGERKGGGRRKGEKTKVKRCKMKTNYLHSKR